MIVERRLARISLKNGRCDVTATTSKMRARLIVYCVKAETPTLATSVSIPSPEMKVTSKPPTAAAQAKTEPL